MARLPELFARDQLPETARHVHDYIVKTRGRISNSYAAMLHAPDVVDPIVHLGTYLRFQSSLDNLTIELIALTTSSELNNPYECALHAPAVVKLGLAPEAISAIQSKSPLPDVANNIAMPVACARELIRMHVLSSALFDRAREVLGDQGVVELVGAVGFYAMLAYMHNALEVSVPKA